MRILYLCADPGVPILGRKGCATHVREIVKALDRAGHETMILCANRGEDDRMAEDLRIEEVTPNRSRRLGFDLRQLLYNGRFIRAAFKAAHEFRPETIYERFSLYSHAGSRISRSLNVPRLLEVNAFLSKEQENRIHFPALARWHDNRIVRQADQVVVVSEPLRQQIAGLGVPLSRIHKMPMTADVRHFAPLEGDTAVRKQYNLEGKYVIGYLGTLSGWHGINMLYDAARILNRELDNYVFFLVGGDEQKAARHREKAAELGLRSRFLFTGSVPFDQAPSHIRAMDVALVPDTTLWSSPTKLFEYMACGAPTVAPRYASVIEALTDGREGLLFDAGNLEQFAACLLELARDPARRRQMGLNARQRVLSGHSIDQQVARIVDLFEKMRRERRNGRQ